MKLYRLVFDRGYYPPCAVTVRRVMAKAYVPPHVSYDAVLRVLVKGGVINFIGIGETKNYIVLCELCLEWFDVVAMYKS